MRELWPISCLQEGQISRKIHLLIDQLQSKQNCPDAAYSVWTLAPLLSDVLSHLAAPQMARTP